MAYAVRHESEVWPPERRPSLLARLRHIEGFSQRALAQRAGVCRATVCNIEAGSHEPRIRTAVAIAAALGYPPAHVFPELFEADRG